MIKKLITDFVFFAQGYESVECKAPCSMYSALLSAGKIKPPYYKENILTAKDEAPKSCEFVATFSVSEAIKSSKHVSLSVSGIYARAELILNGKSYGIIENVNRTFVYDVRDILVVGENRLTVKCISPLPHTNLIKRSSAKTNFDGYEFAPYIGDMGIVGKVELCATNSAVISGVGIVQRHEGGKVILDITVDTVGESDARVVATLVSPVGKLYFGGINHGRGTVTVPDPMLWWPKGMGSPSLYKITVTLYDRDEAVDVCELSVGLRSLGIDENGAVLINGVRMLSMGATYVVEDAILPYITEERVEKLVKAAADANMNTLRLLGSGLYQTDKFFDLCDRLGIMVWQDISLPYMSQSDVNVFVRRFRDELTDAVSRISYHASLAVMFFTPTLTDGDEHPMDNAIEEFCDSCYRVIKPILERYASDIIFLRNPDMLEALDERLSERDMDALKYAVSLPSIDTVSTFATQEDLNLLAPVIETHSVKGCAKNLLCEIADEYRYPAGFEQLIYASQISEAQQIRRSVHKLRASANRSVSAVCRQFNDAWPACSSSQIDYYGRPKAFCYLAREFFAPVTVCVSNSGGRVGFCVSCLSRKRFEGTVTFALYTCDNICVKEFRRDVSCEAMSVSTHISEDMTAYMQDDLSSYFITYSLADSKGIITSGTSLFVPSKRFKFSDPAIRAELTGSGRDYQLTLSAKSYAANVYVDFRGCDAVFSDNFFDMLADVPVKISVHVPDVTTAQAMKKTLKILSVYDIGK